MHTVYSDGSSLGGVSRRRLAFALVARCRLRRSFHTFLVSGNLSLQTVRFYLERFGRERTGLNLRRGRFEPALDGVDQAVRRSNRLAERDRRAGQVRR